MDDCVGLTWVLLSGVTPSAFFLRPLDRRLRPQQSSVEEGMIGDHKARKKKKKVRRRRSIVALCCAALGGENTGQGGEPPML